MKKEYLEFSGTVHKEDGWTEAQYEEFMDKMIELVESYDAQIACEYTLKTEEEL